MADAGPLASLVRTLYDMRLALVALAVIVEVVASGSALTVLALLAALPLSYIPLRHWRSLAGRRDVLVLDAFYAAALTVLVTDPQVMLLYSLATVVLAGLVGGRLGAGAVTTVLGGFLALATLYTAISHQVRPGTVATSLAFVALYMLSAPGALRLTRLLRDYHRATELARAASQQAAYAEERGRLAREMHDSLSKTVHGTHLMAIAVSRRLSRADVEPRLRDDAERLVTACDIATRDARRLLHDLRHDGGGETCSVVRRVEQVVLEWQTRTAVDARVEDGVRTGDDLLPESVVYEVGCVVAEALDNATRHGGAQRVDVEVRAEDGWLRVRIRDDGIGFNVPRDLGALHRSGHYGVIGMRERAQRVGGSVQVESAPGAGTTVALAVPAPSLREAEPVTT